jgi:hypothetical protein
MTHFLFTALCALLLNAGAPTTATVPVDTLNHYVIDNKPVANFDGSQLLGEKIEGYDITTVEKDGQVIRVHQIRTQRGSLSQPLYILDGNAVSATVFQSLDTKAIESISVYKGNGAQAYEKYGNTTNGVIVVNLKEPGTYTPSGEKLQVRIFQGKASRNDDKK